MDFDFKTATPEQLRARYNDIATEMRETQFLSKKELTTYRTSCRMANKCWPSPRA